MPTKQRRYPIKPKEAKQLLDEASKTLNFNVEEALGQKINVEVVESDVGSIYVLNGKPLLFRVEGGKILPTLQFSQYVAKAPKVIVDMGAVPFVCKGADVMAPGIVRIEGEFNAGDLLVVADIKFGKALALGEALMDSANARQTKKGPVVTTLHYVSDKVWDFIKTLTR
jgi:PUA-domain protein